MSKTKLVSLNIGVQLTVLKNGKEEMSSYSATTRNMSLIAIVENTLEFINEELGIKLGLKWAWSDNLKILKPKQIKAHLPVSQDEFNRKVKEIVP